MPRLRTPADLFSASLSTLAGSVLKQALNVLAKTDSSNDSGIVRDLISEIPRFLADDYVAEVLRHVNDVPFQDKKELAGLVLHPQCQRLDMQHPNLQGLALDLRRAVLANLASLTELKYLRVSLSELFEVWEDAQTLLCLESHIHVLHKLEFVDLSRNCNSKVLKSVVENCPNLITFQAINSMLEKGDAQLLSNLTKLEHIRISSRKELISPEDIAHLISHLSSLRYINDYSIDQTIPIIKKWHEEGIITPPFLLKNFGYGVIKLTDLDDLCSLFPRLEAVSICRPTGSITSLKNLNFLKKCKLDMVNPENVYELLKCKNCYLEELALDHTASLYRIFRTIYGFVLTSVTVLNLRLCKSVNLVGMNMSLPNLEMLDLYYCTSLSRNGYWLDFAPKAFLKLKRLSVSGSFLSSHLRYLLAECKELQELTIGGIRFDGVKFGDDGHADFLKDVVTDELWMQITIMNPLKKLERLKITSDRLTKEMIPKIIQPLKELQSLDLEGSQWCDELPFDEAHKLLVFINQYDMKLTVSGSFTQANNQIIVENELWI